MGKTVQALAHVGKVGAFRHTVRVVLRVQKDIKRYGLLDIPYGLFDM